MSTYCFSDLHGHIKLYNKIKEIVKPEDVVYCLGDCGDRGPDSWATIKAVLTDPQFIYIKGNHEDMLVKAAREALSMDCYSSCHRQRLLYSNGGETTITELMKEKNPRLWINQIDNLPLYKFYTNKSGKNILLCHAGCSIWKGEEFFVPEGEEEEFIWDRVHYYDSSYLLDSTIVVHGHTPILYLAADIDVEEPDEWIALEYCDGKKFCIDQGTYFSGHSTLFNLDTFESIDINLKD